VATGSVPSRVPAAEDAHRRRPAPRPPGHRPRSHPAPRSSPGTSPPATTRRLHPEQAHPCGPRSRARACSAVGSRQETRMPALMCPEPLLHGPGAEPRETGARIGAHIRTLFQQTRQLHAPVQDRPAPARRRPRGASRGRVCVGAGSPALPPSPRPPRISAGKPAPMGCRLRRRGLVRAGAWRPRQISLFGRVAHGCRKSLQRSCPRAGKDL
jgi:hypothetical protein